MKAFAIPCLVAALAALGLAPVAAQYPAPQGACTVTGGTQAAPPNTVVTFTVTVLTDGGDPAPDVPGTAAIASQPGGDAEVLTPSFVTNAQGQASIQVRTGSVAGEITLAITCGSLDASSVVSVVAAATPAPPATGDGTLAGDAGSTIPAALLALGAAVVALGGAGTLVAVRRRQG